MHSFIPLAVRIVEEGRDSEPGRMRETRGLGAGSHDLSIV